MFTLHFSMEISRNLVFKNPLIPFPLPKVLVSPTLTYILELFVSKLTIIKKYLVTFFRKLCIKSSNEQNSFLSSNQALANFMGSITCGTSNTEFFDTKAMLPPSFLRASFSKRFSRQSSFADSKELTLFFVLKFPFKISFIVLLSRCFYLQKCPPLL